MSIWCIMQRIINETADKSSKLNFHMTTSTYSPPAGAPPEETATVPFRGSEEEQVAIRELVNFFNDPCYPSPARGHSSRKIGSIMVGAAYAAFGPPSASGMALTTALQSVKPPGIVCKLDIGQINKGKIPSFSCTAKGEPLLIVEGNNAHQKRNPNLPPPNPLATVGNTRAARLRGSGRPRAEAPFYGDPQNTAPTFTDKLLIPSPSDNKGPGRI